jgi:hypothetical protein
MTVSLDNDHLGGEREREREQNGSRITHTWFIYNVVMEASPKKGVSLGSPSLGGKTERKNVGKLVPDIWLPIDKRERERER